MMGPDADVSGRVCRSRIGHIIPTGPRRIAWRHFAAVRLCSPTRVFVAAPFGFADVLRYYQALAAASDLPVLVYYFPELSPSIATLDQIETLCGLTNVCGVKFTDFDLYRMSMIVRPGRSIFNGRDEALAAGLLMGATGGIGSFYNLAPELFVRIYSSACAAQWEDVRAAQQRVNSLIRVVLQFPLFPAIKQMLAWSGLDCGACPPPRARLDPGQQTRLRAGLVSAGFSDLTDGAGVPNR